MKDGTPFGLDARKYYDEGKLVPDSIILGIIKEQLDRPEAKTGAILDGFPRTAAQAELVDRTLAARGQRPIHQLGLRRGAGKAIEDRAGLRLRAVQLLLDDAEDDAVGDQLALVVVLPGVESERRAVLHRRPDEVAGGDLREPETLGEDLPLRPLA